MFGHNAVVFQHVNHIVERAALCKVDGAVGADIFVGLIGLGMAHNEHFG